MLVHSNGMNARLHVGAQQLNECAFASASRRGSNLKQMLVHVLKARVCLGTREPSVVEFSRVEGESGQLER
jgi:hypothetical protein